MGWTPFRTPVIWDKLHQGIGPWQTEGFQRRYELILFCTKGAKGLNAPIPDVLTFKRVPKEQRIHGAQKPTDLLRTLIEATTLYGDTVLDPFAGSGSTLVAAGAANRRAIGIELDDDSYLAATANVFGKAALDDLVADSFQ
jgi:site-specific DNA-methyltransferase (adenine-specific)